MRLLALSAALAAGLAGCAHSRPPPPPAPIPVAYALGGSVTFLTPFGEVRVPLGATGNHSACRAAIGSSLEALRAG